MTRTLISLLASMALAFPLAAPAQDKSPIKPPPSRTGYADISWDELVPGDWDPLKQFKDMNFGLLNDADPRAAEMMKKMGNTITTEVTSVSTGAIDAAIFEIPADYKVSKR